jgi:hypothetical protein
MKLLWPDFVAQIGGSQDIVRELTEYIFTQNVFNPSVLGKALTYKTRESSTIFAIGRLKKIKQWNRKLQWILN